MKVNVGFLLASLGCIGLGVATMFGFATSIMADSLNEMLVCFMLLFGGFVGIFASFEKKKVKVVRYGDEVVVIDGDKIRNV
jgi:hypothetical protein